MPTLRAHIAPNPTAAALYLRVSSTGQEENYSLETQEAACRAYCAEKGYSVVGVFRDVHGGDVLERPGLDALRRHIRAGDIGVVVALVFDRLSRNQMVAAVVLYEAKQHGVRVEFAQEQLEDTPTGQFMRSVMAFAGELEHVRIKERTQRGRKARAASGKLITGAYPLYGYQWADPAKGQRTRYIPDPEVAPVVQRIFREVARGTPLRTLARQLDSDGIPSPSRHFQQQGWLAGHRRAVSEGWRTATIHRMIHHPAYIGEHVAYRWAHAIRRDRDAATGEVVRVRENRVREKDDTARVSLPASVCPPLVDKATAEAAIARLARNKAEATRHHSDPTATLLRSGYIVCGYCGQPMYTHRSQGQWTYFCDYTLRKCPSGGVSIQARLLDGRVWQHMLRVIQRPEFLVQALEGWRQAQAQHTAQADANLRALQGKLAALDNQMNSLLATAEHATTEAARALVAQRLDALTQQRADVDVEMARVRDQDAEYHHFEAQVDSMAAWAAQVAARLHDYTYLDQRRALHTLGVKVVVFRHDERPRFIVLMGFDPARHRLMPGGLGIRDIAAGNLMIPVTAAPDSIGVFLTPPDDGQSHDIPPERIPPGDIPPEPLPPGDIVSLTTGSPTMWTRH